MSSANGIEDTPAWGSSDPRWGSYRGDGAWNYCQAIGMTREGYERQSECIAYNLFGAPRPKWLPEEGGGRTGPAPS
jgi:hypothetical protein